MYTLISKFHPCISIRCMYFCYFLLHAVYFVLRLLLVTRTLAHFFSIILLFKVYKHTCVYTC